MNRWRSAFRRIGGPDAVTWPSFWTSLGASAYGHLSTGGQVDASLAVRLFAIGVAQIAMFVPLLALRRTVLSDPARPHPWVAVAGFVVAASVRTVVLVLILKAVGGIADAQLLSRLVTALPNIVIVFIVTALVVGSLRDQRRRMAELLAVGEDLEQAQRMLEGELREQNESSVSHIRSMLESEIRNLESAQDEQAIANMRDLVNEVVRPLSHELSASVPVTQSWRPARADDSRINWRAVFRDFAQSGRFRPLPTAGLITAIALVPSGVWLAEVQWQTLLAASLGVWLTLTIGNALLDWALPRLRQFASLAFISLVALVASLVPVAFVGVALGGPAGRAFTIGGTMYVAGLAVLVAIASTALDYQERSAQTLADTAEALNRHVIRLRQLQWFQRKSLARALHGPVQSSMTAAMLRLDAAVRSGESTDAVVDSAQQDMLASLQVLESPESTESLADWRLGLEQAWRGVCRVTISVDSGALQVLETDAVLGSIVKDILTDAVSNAARHGGAQVVNATVSLETPSDLALVVTDDGRGFSERTTGGMGTQLLSETTLSWRRSAEDGQTVLTAVLPTVQASGEGHPSD